MRRGRVFIYVAFALLLVMLIAAVIYIRVRVPSRGQPEAQPTVTTPPVNIVIISQNIPKGYVLDQSVLTTIPWQQDAIAPGMVTGDKIREYYGRQVKYDLQAGTPLLDNMLLKEGEQISSAGSAWALNIPPGMVAVSIPINRLTSVSYAPWSGDHVDVIVTMMFVDVDTDFQTITPNLTGVVVAAGPPDPETKERNPLTVNVSNSIYGRTEIDPVLGQAIYLVPSEGQRPRIVSQMLLQDAVVLQVGNFPIQGQEETVGQIQPTPTPQAGEEQAPPSVVKPDIITLIVRPQDAVALNYIMMAQAQLAARLSLALRSANDSSRENILPVTLQFLLEQYQIPVPARLPYSLNPRIDVLSPPGLPND